MMVMATFRYHYTGSTPVHLPLHGVMVESGQEIATDLAVNHPDFELVSNEEKEVAAKKHR